MTDSKQNFAFYIEVMLLLAFLLFTIVILVQVFAGSKAIGVEAQRKSEATLIAQNVAEVFAASDSDEEFVELLSGVDGANGVVESSLGQVSGEIGDYALDVTRFSDDTGAGKLEHAHIEVSDEGSVIFAIDTAKYYSDSRKGVEDGSETD